MSNNMFGYRYAYNRGWYTNSDDDDDSGTYDDDDSECDFIFLSSSSDDDDGIVFTVPMLPELYEYRGFLHTQEVLDDGVTRVNLQININEAMQYTIQVDMHDPPKVEVLNEGRYTVMLQRFLDCLWVARGDAPYEQLNVDSEDAAMYAKLCDAEISDILYCLFEADIDRALDFYNSDEESIFNLLHDHLLYIIPTAYKHCIYCGYKSKMYEELELNLWDWVCEKEFCQYMHDIVNLDNVTNLLDLKEDMDAAESKDITVEELRDQELAQKIAMEEQEAYNQRKKAFGGEDVFSPNGAFSGREDGHIGWDYKK